jgi:protein-S-isoprenylcysteine O-methyltransferase Ste14
MSFFDKFQLASIGAFLLMVAANTLRLRLGKGINPIAIGRGKGGLPLAVELFAFAALVIWLIEIVMRATHFAYRIFPAAVDPTLLDLSVVRMMGTFVVTVAILLFIFAFLSFGSSWRVGLDPKTPGHLVTSGAFAISRNPIFVALDLWFVGIFLIQGSLFFLLFALVAMPLIHTQILREEKLLTELYGQSYRDYLKRVPRYLVW